MRKNKIVKITIVFLIILMLFCSIIPKKVYAENEEETTSGLDTFTGIIIEPTIEFFTFFIDSIMTIFSEAMTQEEVEFVMLNDPINEGDAGATLVLEEDPYKNFLGIVKDVRYPNFTYSSEEIFSGNINLLDINFIGGNNTDSGWKQIRSVIASWYKALRLFSIVGLLSILIYTGIKIMISSAAQDKSKYKERITNWFIAFILLFVMHYIMAFILIVVKEISNLLGNLNGIVSVTMNGETFTTNLIGLARFQMQQQHFSAKITYLVIYVALVVYTFKFTFLYLKRMLRMAFLTLIAPIVALTYPIDKMDGKAKGFQLWLKDYIYNALLQPMHHLLYYILVSSSLTLAAKNPIYGIAAIAFVSEAEKLLKAILGFGRAKGGTVGGLAGAYATGRIASSLTKFIENPFHIGKSSKGSEKGKGNNGENEEDSIPFEVLHDTDVENILIGSGMFYSDDSENPIITEDSSNDRSGTPFVFSELDNNDIDINKLIAEYRKMLLQSNIDISNLEFNDDYNRNLQQIFEQILANQEKLKQAGLTEEEIEKINEEIIRDKSILKNEIWANELPFLLEQIPLQYIDNDNRSSEQISDDILKYMEKARDPRYTVEQQKHYADLANKDMELLNRRMAENTYIDNYRRNNNNYNSNEHSERVDNRNSQNRTQFTNDTVQQNTESEETSNSRIALGLLNVGKTLVKPAWDTDKSVETNTNNLIKNVAKGAVGLAVGATAAAVQAGISITDGKYNALEGAGSFAAGAVGGAKLVDAAGNIKNSLKGEETIQDYSKRWYDRDDVIRNFNSEYGSKAKDMRQRARDEYVTRGIIEFKEQKQTMKFADYLIKQGIDQKEADRIAVATIKYKKDLVKTNNYSMIYDQKKRNKYLEAKMEQYSGKSSKQSIRNIHEQFIEYVREFDKINNT